MIPKVQRVTPGWQWSLSVGYDTHKGKPLRGTDEKIYGGWAPTKERAQELVEEKMEELEAEEEEEEEEQLFG